MLNWWCSCLHRIYLWYSTIRLLTKHFRIFIFIPVCWSSFSQFVQHLQQCRWHRIFLQHLAERLSQEETLSCFDSGADHIGPICYIVLAMHEEAVNTTALQFVAGGGIVYDQGELTPLHLHRLSFIWCGLQHCWF